MGKTFRVVVIAAVEQSRGKANMVAQGDGKFGPEGWPQDPSKPKWIALIYLLHLKVAPLELKDRVQVFKFMQAMSISTRTIYPTSSSQLKRLWIPELTKFI